jgi:ferredoxin-NADP reductase
MTTNASLTSSKTLNPVAATFQKLFDNNWLDFAVSHVNPLFSVTRTKARVVSFHQETPDALSIELQPNQNWAGFQPGQFVPVRVDIQGVIHERCYSITSAPGADTIRITVKRQSGGLVSNWLHQRVLIGDIVELGAAGGEFVLPAVLPEKLLFIAGGSGITPVYSMIRAALAAQPDADIVLGFYARNYLDFILLDELEALREKHAGLRIQLCITGERMFPEDLVGRFSAAQLQSYCSDVAERETFTCGPAGLIESVIAHHEAKGLSGKLHKEYFGLPPVVRAPGSSAEVVYLKSGLTVETTEPTLLQAAEKAGLKPKFGCRMGVCNSCSCMKKEGVVRNVVSGEIDDTPNTMIRICISEPLSAVSLDI